MSVFCILVKSSTEAITKSVDLLLALGDPPNELCRHFLATYESVCARVHSCVCASVCTCTCLHVYSTCTCLHVYSTCTCMYACPCVCTVCMSVHTCMCCLCVYACVFVYVHTCTYRCKCNCVHVLCMWIYVDWDCVKCIIHAPVYCMHAHAHVHISNLHVDLLDSLMRQLYFHKYILHPLTYRSWHESRPCITV